MNKYFNFFGKLIDDYVKKQLQLIYEEDFSNTYKIISFIDKKYTYGTFMYDLFTDFFDNFFIYQEYFSKIKKGEKTK